MGRADSRPVPRVGRYSGNPLESFTFRLRGCHPLWPGFPAGSTRWRICHSMQSSQKLPWLPLPPPCNARELSHTEGLGSSLFARRYWGSRCLFLFLQVLRWVSSLRYPPYTMDSCTAHEGLPRVVSESREPPDHCPLATTRSFSQLNHALLRLLVPSHPHVHPF